jgi:uncharacterized lipoprotein YajG
MVITIDVADQKKRSMLILHDAAGRMVHLQFVEDVEKQIEQIKKEGFEEIE